MSRVKKTICLSEEDRRRLIAFVSSGTHSARLVRRAQIALSLDTSQGRTPVDDGTIAQIYNTTRQTVQNVKSDFLAAESIDVFLSRKKRETPPVAPKITGDVEARMIALCCGEPPEGYARWTVRLVADKMVELEIVDSISPMSVSRTLKKTNFALT